MSSEVIMFRSSKAISLVFEDAELIELTRILMDAEAALDASGITMNKNAVPFDDKPPMITSGIRIGTPAVTTRGMKEREMDRVAEYIDKALNNVGNENVYNEVQEEVAELCRRFPVY